MPLSTALLLGTLIGCDTAPPPTAPTAINSIPRIDADNFRIEGRKAEKDAPAPVPRTNRGSKIEWGTVSNAEPSVGNASRITIGIRRDAPGKAPRRWRVSLLFVGRMDQPYRGVKRNGQAIALDAGMAYVTVVEQKPGAVAESWLRRIPISAFATGFTDAIRAAESSPRNPDGTVDFEANPDPARTARIVSGMLCGLTLSAPFQEDSSLRDLALEVCKIPSYLSIAFSLGVSISVQFRFGQAIRMPDRVLEGSPQSWPIYSVPVTVAINDAPSLECRVLVTDPGPPLTLVGGLLGLVGEQPGNPDYRVSAKVLSASAGLDPKPVQPYQAPISER